MKITLKNLGKIWKENKTIYFMQGLLGSLGVSLLHLILGTPPEYAIPLYWVGTFVFMFLIALMLEDED